MRDDGGYYSTVVAIESKQAGPTQSKTKSIWSMNIRNKEYGGIR